MLNKAGAYVRKTLLKIADNEGLFLFVQILLVSVLTMGPLLWHHAKIDLLDRYVLLPWGMALCLLRLERHTRLGDAPVRRDMAVLFVLAVWVVAPFALRFGITANNISNWFSFIVAYFVIYGKTSEEEKQNREKILDLVSTLFMLLSIVLGALLLFCAAQGTAYGTDLVEFKFGVQSNGELSRDVLCMGHHHNTTGMYAMCFALMSLIGFARRKNKLLRLAHLAGAALMTLVVILSQSRTARYSLLLVLALGCYGVVAAGSWSKKTVVRHAAGMLAAAVVVVGGLAVSARITNAALAHYDHVRMGDLDDCMLRPAAAIAQETQAAVEAPVQGAALQARGMGDSTFTGRTLIWKNIFKLWRENPKYMIIGNGPGNTGRQIAAGTMLESGGSTPAHNAYLQYAADFGLIGFALLAAFLAMQVMPCLRVFFARGNAVMPGGRVLCMVVAAALITGMMESDTLVSMRAINTLMLFSLGVIYGHDSDVRRKNS